MGWREKTVECFGSVLFRGSMPPRPEEFEQLARQGIRITPAEDRPSAHWAVDLAHEQWGTASMTCLRNVPRPPRLLIEHDANLSPDERETARLGGSTVTVSLSGTRGNVLRDRKLLLRFLSAVMGEDGLVAVDHVAQRFWSRQALADELCHDADLDIEGLYTLHAVGPDDEEDHTVTWLHSHGLAEMGFFDFDILQPSDDLFIAARDALRAIALAIVEGRVARSTPRYALANPDGDIRLVEVGEFVRRAERSVVALRAGADEEHARNRSVVCEPASGVLGRWFGGIRPSVLLSSPVEDDKLMSFSHEASELMAERARGTYGLFRAICEELEEFDLPRIVKLAYATDRGDDDGREHLWFEVHELRDDRIDATLRNAPFYIARMREGQRDWHEIDKLSDWAVMTPLGMITPRNTAPLRTIRARRDEFRHLMAEARKAQETQQA